MNKKIEDCAGKFIPLYFKDKIKIINPYASIGIITLWSNIDSVLANIKKAGADLTPLNSKIATIGNLYGEGFRYLLRNLLYNPSIDTLIIMGADNSGSLDYIVNFFNKGTQPADIKVSYKKLPDQKNISCVKVIDTDYYMDSLVSPDIFVQKPKIINFGKNRIETAEKLAKFLKDYTPSNIKKTSIIPRIKIDVPDVESKFYPSNIGGHTIIEKTPSLAWMMLVHRIMRFGREVLIKKGKRQELLNVKVVIENPYIESDETIKQCGFSPDFVADYQKKILSSDINPDSTYTYGNRLRAYFGLDCIDTVADELKKGLDDRNCYMTTWDNKTDILADHRPCLVSLFFRKNLDKLYLTAVFRTHNASDAWLENVYGLIEIQNYVCKKIGTAPDALCVISNSISLDPAYIEKASSVYDKVMGFKVEEKDPNGYFIINTENKEIVLQHWYGSNIINEYRGKTPLAIQHKLLKDIAISDINHAIYIGRQLEKAYRCILDKVAYVQK